MEDRAAVSAFEFVEGHVQVDPLRFGQNARIIRANIEIHGEIGPDGHRAVANGTLAVGNKRRGLAPCWVPSPSQTGHQPSGLLNEKWWGESSSKLRPQLSQLRCWL